MKFCHNCGGKVEENVKFCPYCGTQLENSETRTLHDSNAKVYTSADSNSTLNSSPSSSSNYSTSQSRTVFEGNRKDRIVAALLAIFLGGFGVHKFYLGNITMGIIYLILSFTGIPEIIGFIEGIIYLTKNDEEFYRDHVLPIEEKRASLMS
ncbi:MAG: NINE protein [Promethearchaeota archaeon]